MKARTPVGVGSNACPSQLAHGEHVWVLCDDGSFWSWYTDNGNSGWREREPVPGSERASELVNVNAGQRGRQRDG